MTAAVPYTQPADQGWPQRRLVEVAVRERFLWIDNEAYPLHNIARAAFFPVRTNVWRAFLRFFKRCGIAALIVIGTAIVLAVTTGPVGFLMLEGFMTAAWVVAGLTAFVSLILLLAELGRPPRFALSVETAGPPYALVTTTDPAHAAHLVECITYAINNPETEFRYVIEHVHYGDNITQIGDHSSVHKR
ncbi:DUF6232 family protein [Actinokineospora fastidiosa]|uniref:Uncharacterized protein n=1 Tax=Actinokineospora fastidiosa TaxID=1816 RepID=A0A918G328_9PSEU|nr:DUF6232 family protein [Actinokineospora fastidiosa]GGS14503.1 hypothetical protein GCM10010171_03000 [Actinokineospora fastidiosa]